MALPLALVWDLIAVDNASGVFKKVSAAADSTAGSTAVMQKAIVGAGAAIATAVVATGALSAKMAMTFQSSMLLIQTQAGASKDEVTTMSKAILDLAGPVATAPDQLALSLYHVESVGLRSAQALEVVKIAAEGAKVGNASLEETTNALTASVASGIPGVQNMTQAMGQLNTIVGAGDMKMQDLNEALGSGILTVVKGFGLSLTDVGAALATFGDNNIRGADAATMLRMAVQAMAKPVAGGAKQLEALGITTGQLAKDMQQGGLKKALEDLQEHMQKSGIKADQMGSVLLNAFGKKAGPGIAVLEGQMDRFHTKFDDIKNAGDSFGSDWQAWLGSVQGQWDGLKGKLESIAIKIGTALLPVVSDLIDKFSKAVDWVEKNKSMLGELAAVLVVTAGAIKIITTVTAIWNAVAAANPLSLVVLAVAALVAGLIYAYNHSKAFHDFVVNSWPKIKAAAETVVQWFEKKAWPVLVKIWDAVRDAVSAFVKWFESSAWPAIKKAWDAVSAVVAAVVGWLETEAIPAIKGVWDTIASAAREAADWYMQNVAPVFAAFGDMMGALFGRIGSIVSWLWEHIFHPVIDLIVDYWRAMWKVLSAAWDNFGVPLITLMKDGWRVFADVLGGIWGGIKAAFSFVWNEIKIIVETVLGVIKNVFEFFADVFKGHWSNALGDLRNIFATIWDGISRTVSNAISTIGDVIGSIRGTISNVFRDAGTWLYDAGKAIINGLTNGISNMAGSVWDAIKNIGQGVTNTFKSVLGIKSPSTVFAGHGVNIGEGLINGLDSVQDRVNGRVSALVNPPNGAAGANARPGVGGMNITNNIYEAVSAEATANQVTRRIADRGV